MEISKSAMFLLLALLARSPALAGMELAPPALPPVKIAGFVHSWIAVGDRDASNLTGNSTFLGGSLLKRLRLRVSSEPFDGVQVVIIPELAGGFALLDGYLVLNTSQVFFGKAAAGPLSFTLGQFKTPFGLNRMYLPPQLTAVDYSSVSRGVFGSTSFWDAGLMMTYKKKLFKLDLAVVEGLGPNQALPSGNAYGLKKKVDGVGRLELSLRNGLLLIGASGYYGTHYVAPGTAGFTKPETWGGAHFKLKGLPKTYEIESEVIKREDDRYGVNTVASYWLIGKLQIFGLYERVEDRKVASASATKMGGGLNFLPQLTGPTRLTLQIQGESTGPREKPFNSKTVLQTQVLF